MLRRRRLLGVCCTKRQFPYIRKLPGLLAIDFPYKPSKDPIDVSEPCCAQNIPTDWQQTVKNRKQSMGRSAGWKSRQIRSTRICGSVTAPLVPLPHNLQATSQQPLHDELVGAARLLITLYLNSGTWHSERLENCKSHNLRPMFRLTRISPSWIVDPFIRLTAIAVWIVLDLPGRKHVADFGKEVHLFVTT